MPCLFIFSNLRLEKINVCRTELGTINGEINVVRQEVNNLVTYISGQDNEFGHKVYNIQLIREPELHNHYTVKILILYQTFI